MHYQPSFSCICCDTSLPSIAQHVNLPEIAHTCKCAEGHRVCMSEYYTCSCVCCDTSLPLIYSTWSPSFSRGIHTSAGVLGATRDTMIGMPWSAPPYNDITCTVKPVIYDHRVIRPPFIYDHNLKDQYSILH